jgi:hypothetical protein
MKRLLFNFSEGKEPFLDIVSYLIKSCRGNGFLLLGDLNNGQ